MSEDTVQNTDNALVRHDGAAVQAKAVQPPVIFDADARNRFEFDVREGVKQYETAHVFNPLSDERYMQWFREFKISGNEDNVQEEGREASARLWDDLIHEVENIKVPDGEDFQTLIPSPEKLEAITQFLNVAIGEDIVKVEGVRELGVAATQTVLTECFFNGQVAVQSHELKPVTFELQKKYSRIEAKRFKQEKIGGLRKRQNVEFVPQDDKIGELYDDMFVSAEGFAGGKIPLRFKTTVIHHLFAERLAQKKSAT